MIGRRAWWTRLILYLWVSPTSSVGVLMFILAKLSGGCAAVVEGVLEVHGGIVTWILTHGTFLKGGASAMTLGHVVIGRNAEALAWTRRHERVHVRQCERWGPLFYPAYVGASVWAWLRGGHPYLDNAFEREAYAEAS